MGVDLITLPSRCFFFWLLLFSFVFVGSTEALAFELSKSRSKAACIETSIKLGAPRQKKLAKCYGDYADRLSKKIARSKKQRGSGFDQDLRTSACQSRFSISEVPSFDDSDVAEEPKLSKSYLERFQKRLIPYGKKVADCYSSLAQGTLALSKFKKGKLLVELEIGSDGMARQVVLTEKTKLDGYVVGCVVRELCGLWASPPPGGKSFYLELPFSFKKPKS